MTRKEYRPRPSVDPLDDTFRYGWRFVEDVVDPVADLPKSFPPEDEDRSLERAKKRCIEEGIASYVVDVGVVYDVEQTKDGRWLVLIFNDLVDLRAIEKDS